MANGTPAASGSSPSSYTAVVYFHGMGQQRHYEELSRLVERLDQLIFRRHHAGDPDFPAEHLTKIWARQECLRNEGARPEDLAVYIEAELPERDQTRKKVRFYEAYWAPETTGGSTARGVLWWLARQLKKPLLLTRSRWRGFERLRRSDLVHLYERRRQSDPASEPQLRKDVAFLIRRYSTFHQLGSRRAYPKGNFRDFLRFLADSSTGKRQADLPRLEELARAWCRHHVTREWTNVFLVASVLVGAAAAVGFLLLGLYEGLALLHSALPAAKPEGQPLLAFLAGKLRPGIETAVGLFATLCSMLGVTGFLVNYVGDVQQFATYEETDERYKRRKAILGQSCALLRHVLADERCERVVVVSHSLGTAVALDTLFDLRRLNEAHNLNNPMEGRADLGKIRHMMTLASPIDKINYFFAVVQSRYHRYERVADELRGDLSLPPFSKVGRQPHMHWVNYWDRGDIISGPIESLTGADLSNQEVDNVRLAVHALPNPAASHSAYLDHAQVLCDLSRFVFRNHHRWARPPPPGVAAAADEADAVPCPRVGPGGGSLLQSALFFLLLMAPWLFVAATVEMAFLDSVWARWSLLALVALLGGGMAFHALFRSGERLLAWTHDRLPRGPR